MSLRQFSAFLRFLVIRKEDYVLNKTSYGLVDADKLDELITVDLNGLRTLTSLGKYSARSIAEEAGAVIKIGKRTIFSVDKIRQYMNDIAE